YSFSYASACALFFRCFPTRRSSDLEVAFFFAVLGTLCLVAGCGGVRRRAHHRAGDGRGRFPRYLRRLPCRRRFRLHPSARPFSTDRKSTRLNSSHVKISYAVFCLKK